jgi:hypothetical protein
MAENNDDDGDDEMLKLALVAAAGVAMVGQSCPRVGSSGRVG